MEKQNFKIVLRCKTNYNSLITLASDDIYSITELPHLFSTLLNGAILKLDLGEDIVELKFIIN